MADYKNNVSEKKGKVIYNIGIVKGIVRLAVEDVSGVAIQYKKRISSKSRQSFWKRTVKKSTDGIKVDCSNGLINVAVSVDVYYGYGISDVAYDIQRNIKHSVESMSKYKIGSIDVKVNGVIFPEENVTA